MANAKENILLLFGSPLSRIAKATEGTDHKMSMVVSGIDVLVKGSDKVTSILEKQTDVLLDIKKSLKDLQGELKGSGGKGSPKVKLPGVMDGIGAGLAIVTMAAALVAAAGIFTLMPSVNPMQLLTALAIGGIFVILAPVFVEITESLKGGGTYEKLVGKMGGTKGGFSGLKDTLKGLAGTGLAMIVMALGIAATSVVFQFIMPISGASFITALAIGVAFIPLSIAFGFIIKALSKSKVTFDKNGLKTLAMAGLSMVAITIAIAGVAVAMQLLPSTFSAAPPVEWILKTGLMLLAFSFPLTMILKAVKGLNLKQMIFAALALPLLALAIVGISYVFEALSGKYTAPPLEWIMKTGLAIAIFSIPMVLVLKGIKGVGLKGVALAALAIPLIAGAIVGSALAFTFLDMVGAFNAPPWKWSLEVALAMAVFGVAFYLISKATKSMGLKQIAMASVAMGFIALGILAVAFIFQFLPDEFKAPPVEWSLKAGASLAIFGLGFMIVVKLMKTFGVGLKDLAMGLVGVVAIGIAVLATAWIFSVLPGSFIPIPIEWTIGAVFAISAFAVPLGVVGLIATSGVGAAALGLGALGMILLAGTIWAVAWIFSKLPDLGAIGKNFTDMLLAPVNGMIDSFVRIKEELGIENLSALGAGLVSIAGGWLALVGALAGQAAGDLVTGALGAGKKVLDFVSFGLTATEGPFDVLDKLIRRRKGITSLGPAVAAAGKGFAELSKYQSKGVKALNALLPFSNEWRVKYLRSSATHVGTLAKNYGLLAKESNKMNVGAINATTKMFDSLRKLAEQDNNPMKVLADDLLKAVAELSTAVEALDKAVARQGKTSGEATGVIGKALNRVKDLVTSNTAEVKKNTPAGGAPKMDLSPVVDAILDLEETLTSSGIKVKKNSGW